MAKPNLSQRLIALGQHLRDLDSESPEGAMMIEAANEIELLLTAIRRIASLEIKNVELYAQEIARSALKRIAI